MDDESVDGYSVPCCFTYKSDYKVGVKKLAKVDTKNIRLADLILVILINLLIFILNYKHYLVSIKIFMIIITILVDLLNLV